MHLPSLKLLAVPFLVLMIGVFTYSHVQNDCVTTEDGHRFCMKQGDELDTISEAELRAMPVPVQSQYRAFLASWEADYALRTQEWAGLYANFHAAHHSEQENIEFNRELASEHRDFVLLFRDRDKTFRSQLGLD